MNHQHHNPQFQNQQLIDEFLQVNDSDYAQLSKKGKGTGSNLITGIIVKIDSKYVTVDAGLKEEGRIPITEFKEYNHPLDVKIGDQVTIYRVVSSDGNSTYFSRSRAKKEAIWSKLEEAYQTHKNFTATIISYNKGKYEVELMGITASLDEKQLEVRVSDPKTIMGHTIPVKIIKLDRSQGKITVSQKQAIDPDENDVIHGTVTSVEQGRAILVSKGQTFVLKASDYLWEHTSNLSDKLKIEQVIRVKIIRKSEDGTIYVSHKILSSDPWSQSVEQAGIHVGTGLEGVVVSHIDGTNVLNLDTKPPVQGILEGALLDIGSKHNIIIKTINKKTNTIIVELYV